MMHIGIPANDNQLLLSAWEDEYEFCSPFSMSRAEMVAALARCPAIESSALAVAMSRTVDALDRAGANRLTPAIAATIPVPDVLKLVASVSAHQQSHSTTV